MNGQTMSSTLIRPVNRNGHIKTDPDIELWHSSWFITLNDVIQTRKYDNRINHIVVLFSKELGHVCINC